MQKNCGTIKCDKPNNSNQTLKKILKEFSITEILGMTVAFLAGCALVAALAALTFLFLNTV